MCMNFIHLTSVKTASSLQKWQNKLTFLEPNMTENYQIYNIFLIKKKKVAFSRSKTDDQTGYEDQTFPCLGKVVRITYIWAFLCTSCFAGMCRSIQNAGKHSLLHDEWNNSMDTLKVHVYAMAASCLFVFTFTELDFGSSCKAEWYRVSFFFILGHFLVGFCLFIMDFCLLFLVGMFVVLFVLIGIIALIMYKERGLLTSWPHSIIHMELWTTN